MGNIIPVASVIQMSEIIQHSLTKAPITPRLPKRNQGICYYYTHRPEVIYDLSVYNAMNKVI